MCTHYSSTVLQSRQHSTHLVSWYLSMYSMYNMYCTTTEYYYRATDRAPDQRDLPTDLPTDRKVPVPTEYRLTYRCTCTFTYREGFGICSVGKRARSQVRSEIRNQKSDCDWNEPVYPGRYCSFTHSPNYVCSPHWRGMCRVRHIGMTRCCQRASISALSSPQLECLTLT